MSQTTKTMYANMEQFLLELMGDYLDSDCVKMDMLIAGVKDPLPVHETELHIEMAKAAMNVFRNTVVPT